MALPDLLGAVRRVLSPTTAQEVQALLQQAFAFDPVSTDRLAAALPPLEASGRLEDAAALTCLLEAGDLPVVWQTLDRRGPVLALAAWRYVFAHAGQPTPAVAVARALFQRCLLARPEAVALLPDSARPAALALRRSLGAELPAAAWTSPWAAAPRARGGRKPMEVEPLPWTERFHHLPLPDLPPDEEADRRLLEVLRHARAVGATPLWPLMRLTLGAALAQWRQLDVSTVQVFGPEPGYLIPRLGLAGLETSLALARVNRAALPGLRELESPRVAPLMAPHLTGQPTQRALARAWLKRFPEVAAVGLVPAALGVGAEARGHARAALRWLLRHHGEPARQGLERYPAPVRAAVEAALEEARPLPRRRPALPGWVDPSRLPRPVLEDGAASLQGEAFLELVQLLAATPLQGGPWLSRLRAELQPATLEALAWALFQAWLGHGAEPKARWALHALAHFPTPAAAQGLAALAAELAPSGRSARAQEMVEVLAAMGTRESLLAVQRLSQAVTSRAFRARAHLVFQAAAEAQGFSAAELAERLAPDLGLPPEGWLPGAPRRRLEVTGLRVQVVDEGGAPVRTPAAGPDELGPLTREAELLVREGAARLEGRMLQGVGMTVEHFTETYLMHPLLRPLAAGLVWSAQDDRGHAVTFTVGAQGPEDVQGRLLPLPVEHRVLVAYPTALTEEERQGWLGRLPAQPILQLRRHRRSVRDPAELAVRLQALQGREVPTAVLLRLQARGWAPGEAPEGGLVRTLTRQVEGSGEVGVVLEPGFEPVEPRGAPFQRLVWFRLSLRAETPAALLDGLERELMQVLRGAS